MNEELITVAKRNFESISERTEIERECFDSLTRISEVLDVLGVEPTVEGQFVSRLITTVTKTGLFHKKVYSFDLEFTPSKFWIFPVEGLFLSTNGKLCYSTHSVFLECCSWEEYGLPKLSEQNTMIFCDDSELISEWIHRMTTIIWGNSQKH